MFEELYFSLHYDMFNIKPAETEQNYFNRFSSTVAKYLAYNGVPTSTKFIGLPIT